MFEKPSFEERDGFIFIGNYNHEPNVDALCFLKEVIWPKIKIKTEVVPIGIKLSEINKKKTYICLLYTSDAADE